MSPVRARKLTSAEIRIFRNVVRKHFKKEGRDLPWRKTTDPYRILVSEVMLQQTQVERVIPKYREFLKEFPTMQALAKASLGDVLRVWSGLGYNRRAKMLWECAKEVAKERKGVFPKPPPPERVKKQLGDTCWEHVRGSQGARTRDSEHAGSMFAIQTVSGLSDAGDKVDETFKHALTKLPGIGPYTAGALMAFAYNKPVVMIETNIRAVYLHHFYKDKKDISDAQLLPLIEETLDTKNPRLWYNMLMDYGSWIKSEHGNPNRKSKHHVRQKPFKGSVREVRGAILRALTVKPHTLTMLCKATQITADEFEQQLIALTREGLTEFEKGKWKLP